MKTVIANEFFGFKFDIKERYLCFMFSKFIIMYRIKIIALLVLLPFISIAQSTEPGNWIIYFGNKQINDKVNWHYEAQYRNFNFIGDIEQLLLRTGLGYNLSDNNNNIHLGYAYIYSEPYLVNSSDKISVTEHRIYQQFITRQEFNRILIQHRYRFEQRSISNDLRLRLRYFLAINVALTQKQMQDNTVYFSAYNEIFLNTRNAYFDRNRLYGGVGYRFNKNVRIELGLMNQVVQNSARNQLNMIAFVNF